LLSPSNYLSERLSTGSLLNFEPVADTTLTCLATTHKALRSKLSTAVYRYHLCGSLGRLLSVSAHNSSPGLKKGKTSSLSRVEHASSSIDFLKCNRPPVTNFRCFGPYFCLEIISPEMVRRFLAR